MDITSLLEGGGLVIGGAAVMKIIDVVANAYSARNQRTTIYPQPIEVRESPALQSVEECRIINRQNREEHENMFARISALEKSSAENSGKLGIILDIVNRIEARMNKRRTA
jgi:hypothetical protein